MPKVLVGKTAGGGGGGTLGKPSRKCEDNVKTNLKELRWKCVECFHLVKDRDKLGAVVYTAMNL